MASSIEFLSILFTSFALNLIPFAGPSNLLIATDAAIISTVNPAIIGFLVAFGAATAKFIHYMITFFLSNHVGEQRRKRLDAAAPKLRRWGSIALFIAAATPLPDEPVIIPLGLVKYNPAKFFVVYFAGKLSITIVGAYLGRIGQNLLTSVVSQETLMIISIVLTVAVTIILLKVDVGRVIEGLFKRKTKPKE